MLQVKAMFDAHGAPIENESCHPEEVEQTCKAASKQASRLESMITLRAWALRQPCRLHAHLSFFTGCQYGFVLSRLCSTLSLVAGQSCGRALSCRLSLRCDRKLSFGSQFIGVRSLEAPQ